MKIQGKVAYHIKKKVSISLKDGSKQDAVYGPSTYLTKVAEFCNDQDIYY